jgi:hypothetical protein
LDYIYNKEATIPRVSYWLSWSFSLATMTRLTVTEYLCHKWPQICSTCRKHFPVLI